jgi:hypothetical protein
VRDGDAGIRCELVEIKKQTKEQADHFLDLSKDVAVLKVNQMNRLDKEKLEAETKTRSGR